MSDPTVAAPIRVRNAAMTEPYTPPVWGVRAGAGQLRGSTPPPAPRPTPLPPAPAPTAPPAIPIPQRKPEPRTMTPAVPAAPSKKPRTTGAARRDRAIERVTLSERREWQQLHDRELTRFLIERGGRAFLPEDFRHWFAQRGHPAPHHPNVWGGLWMHAAREQLVVKTGKYRQMQARRSHARVTAEWRKA